MSKRQSIAPSSDRPSKRLKTSQHPTQSPSPDPLAGFPPFHTSLPRTPSRTRFGGLRNAVLSPLHKSSAPGSRSPASTDRVEVVIPVRRGSAGSDLTGEGRRSSRRVVTPTKKALESYSQDVNGSKKSRSRGPSGFSLQSSPEPSSFNGERDLQTNGNEDEQASESESGDEELDQPLLPTRSQFLTNETLRKSREARNFVWRGDTSEPRALRGGKVVERQDTGRRDPGEVDEGAKGGGEGGTGVGRLKMGARNCQSPRNGVVPSPLRKSTVFGNGDEEGRGHVALDVDMDENEEEEQEMEDDQTLLKRILHPSNSTPTISPDSQTPLLHPSLISHLHKSISSLSRPPPPSTPLTVPFSTESENDGLAAILNILRGTVDRGEGNSCLVLGSKGSGKTRTIDRAIHLLRTEISTVGKQERQPIVIRLDGLAQTNDGLAIREMGRQIAEGEGGVVGDEEDEEAAAAEAEAFPPTTLPAHLLAQVTAPSPRAIIVVMENFDLFMDHARQALLYCLLDVVQGIRTGPVEQTGRGVIIVGVTTKVNSHFKLEKRVKSRFSQRVIRVTSPLAGNIAQEGHWKRLVLDALCPWQTQDQGVVYADGDGDVWKRDWEVEVKTVLDDPVTVSSMQRLVGLTADVRLLHRALIQPIHQLLSGQLPKLTTESVTQSIKSQSQLSEWGDKNDKLRDLSHPALVTLIIAKTFAWAGREEFNFAMVETEYQRICKTEMAGKGKFTWSMGVMQTAWKHLISLGILIHASRTRPPANPYMHQFVMCRCILSKTDIVNFFKAETGGAHRIGLGSEWMTIAKRAGGNV